MATRTTDTSSSEEEICYTYYSSTECESVFEYEGKAGYILPCPIAQLLLSLLPHGANTRYRRELCTDSL